MGVAHSASAGEAHGLMHPVMYRINTSLYKKKLGVTISTFGHLIPARHLQGQDWVGTNPFATHPAPPAKTGSTCSVRSQLSCQFGATLTTKRDLSIGFSVVVGHPDALETSSGNVPANPLRHVSTSSVSLSISSPEMCIPDESNEIPLGVFDV